LLNDPLVREALHEADLIVPSLDAVTQDVFERVDRPHKAIQVSKVIDGLLELRKEFKGKIWLEVMLVRGVNDDIRYIKKLKEVLDTINPDKIQLNSPVRTTAEDNILPVDKSKLEKIKEILGEKAEIF
jgi:wyosine [tRNA(Phe)-imidazoG37] synthetase (radical SAM superfamily)